MKRIVKMNQSGSLVVLFLVVSLLAIFISPSKTQAAPYLGCDTNGYIFKYQNTTTTEIQAIDMVTGAATLAATKTNHQLNAMGYNPKDNHFYGWDLNNGTFVRVSSDFNTVQPLTISGYAGPTANIFTGDVDVDGHYWQLVSNTWYQIDLNTPNPTFIASGTPGSNPPGSEGTDWAFMPGTDHLYRGMNETTHVSIYAFSRTSKSWSLVGAVPNVSAAADLDIGAAYADPHKNFYMSSHDSGRLWRVDTNGAAPFTAALLGTSTSGSNDGARCALASVPADFGDAPSSYSTLITDAPSGVGGPRHKIINFNIPNSTAALMLGKKIDIENDGLPNATAAGDDDDHEGVAGGPFVDDERGVTHIVAPPGNTTPLTVPVYATNTSGQAATLVGWIDLDNDGAFEAAERVSASVPAGFNGYQQLTFPAPAAPYSTNTYARFRLFAAGDTSTAATTLSPTGPASGGEVEDVLVQVGAFDVNKTANPAEGTTVTSGQNVMYTLTIRNTGATTLNNLKIDDNLSDVLDDATLLSTSVSPASAGTASVSDNVLEFTGDIGSGQTITVTYTVKIKEGGALGNSALNNSVLAAHSTSCHPSISNGTATVSDPDCQTAHAVSGLADTGSNSTALTLLAVGLLGLSGIGLYVAKRRLVSK